MNKKLIILIFILLCMSSLIKSVNYDLNDLKKLVNLHIENLQKIKELEKKLINYKFTSGNDFFNIINRKNIEKNIQKRNQILKNINDLTIENLKIFKKLSDVHDLLYNDLKNNRSNNDFRFVIDYLDGLKTDNYLKIICLCENDIIRLYKEAKFDVLKAKYGSQDIIVKSLDNFVFKLKFKLKIYNDNDKNGELLSKIELLDKKLTEFKVSQQNILKYIK